MFTGIIEAVGKIVAAEPNGGDLRLRVQSNDLDLGDVQLGDSIATNGVCLTVVELPGDGYWADVSVETLDFTTLRQWKVGRAVNLEKALTPTTRLGGHLVSGHVDGVGEVISRHKDARSERFRIKAPSELARYIAHKGSITVDGTSLTVNAVDGAEFELNIVPHTIEKTVIGTYQPGTQVNLEVDVIARYLERLLLGNDAASADGSKKGIDIAFLAENGFYRR
ncbi:riboflavin synthase [Pseudomaricurvus alkylphenolicus]|uniref:riboflavin synthase n=1 Tax=Pseudomaricurvus alkylphenolicus TaxID=1306991 RepID=UPI0014221E79|nr:riboflavin synthase [Pseudomaricurvus alkylphenolicus]NIB39053.1 riboflavin synthase [Pseudomaricurvus alkylphenolicus]